MKYLITILLFAMAFLACSDSSGPSASENVLSGAVNLEEIPGATSSDVVVYLVEFESGYATRVDTVTPDFDGEYEFAGFEYGLYGVEALTTSGFAPTYYGFHDADYDGVFETGDGVAYNSYRHVSEYNVPMYGDIVDTTYYEFEPNDQVFDAQDLYTIHAAHIEGSVSSGGYVPPHDYIGDIDLYAFTSVWDGYLVMRLDWYGAADLDLYLYDGSGYDVLESSAVSGLGPENIYRSLRRGEEYIVLVASSDYMADYELSIRIE